MKTKEKTTAKKTYVLTVKMPPALGRELKQFATDTGYSISDVVKGSVQETIRQGMFSIVRPERMTPKLEAELAEIHEDIKHGRNLSPVLSTQEEVEHYLDVLTKQAAHERSIPQTVRKRVR